MSRPYLRFGVILLVSLGVMFVLSLLHVDTLADFMLNLSNFYISLTMVAAMGLVMLVGMRGMFQDRRRTALTAGGLVVLLVAGVVLARTETFVGDKGFLQSMIPHHSRAILVCQQSTITDPEIAGLCASIVQSQSEEIRQMKDILARY